MSNVDEIKYLVEELANRVIVPDNISDESLLVTKSSDGQLQVQSFTLSEGCTVAKLNGVLVSVPYNGLEIKKRVEPGITEPLFNQFSISVSNKLIFDIAAEDPDIPISGSFEMLFRALRSGEMAHTKFGQLGEFPQYELFTEFVNNEYLLKIKNLDSYSIEVNIKVAK